jgi:hypothetical protein
LSKGEFSFLFKANAAAWEDIIVAKKEAVGLQMEAVYRSRLQEAYTQVNIFSSIVDISVQLFELQI